MEEKEQLYKYKTQTYECTSGQEEEEQDQLRELFPVYDDHFAPVEDDLGLYSDKETTAGKNLS